MKMSLAAPSGTGTGRTGTAGTGTGTAGIGTGLEAGGELVDLHDLLEGSAEQWEPFPRESQLSSQRSSAICNGATRGAASSASSS